MVVYIPIVPTRLGDIYVTVHASTLIGQDQVTRKLHVEVRQIVIQIDKLPAYIYSVLLFQNTNKQYSLIFKVRVVLILSKKVIPASYYG